MTTDKSVYWLGASSFGRIGSPASGIRRLTIDAHGSVRLDEPVDVGPNPMFVAIRGDVLAVANEVPEGAVSLWRIEGSSLAALRPPQSTRAAAPCHLAFVGDSLWATNFHGSSISEHDANTGAPMTFFPLRDASGGDPRQAVAHPHQTVVDSGRDRLLVPDLGADRIRVISVAGLATDEDIELSRGSGPHHLIIVGDRAIVANELDRSIAIVDLETKAELDRFRLAPPPPAGAFGVSALCMPRPNTVLFADRAYGRIHAVRVDVAAGRVVADLGSVPSGGDHPRELALTPDGRYLLVANQASDVVTVFALGVDGFPVEVVDSVSTPAPSCFALETVGG